MPSPQRDVDSDDSDTSEREAKRKRRNYADGVEVTDTPPAGPSSVGDDAMEVDIGKDTIGSVEQSKFEEGSRHSLSVADTFDFLDQDQQTVDEDEVADYELIKLQKTLFGYAGKTRDENPESACVPEIQRLKRTFDMIQRMREVHKDTMDPYRCALESFEHIKNGENSAWKHVFKSKGEKQDTIEEVLAESKDCESSEVENVLKDHVSSDPIDDMLADEMRKGGLLEGVPAEDVFKVTTAATSVGDFPCNFFDESKYEKKKQTRKRRDYFMSGHELTSDGAIFKDPLCNEDMVVLGEPDDVSLFNTDAVPDEPPWKEANAPPTNSDCGSRECKSPPFLDFDTLLSQEEPDYDRSADIMEYIDSDSIDVKDGSIYSVD